MLTRSRRAVPNCLCSATDKVRTSSKMLPFLRAIRNFILEIVYIILAIVFTLTLPVFLLLLIPVYLIRRLVASYAARFKPDLGKILTARSSVFAVDGVYTKPEATLLTLLVVEGDLTPEEFKDILRRRLINKKDTETGELLHPELTQHLTKWAGFFFWKPEPNFQLDDHVFVTTAAAEVPFNEQTMLEYNTNLVEIPYKSNQSPWEFHLVRNYKPFGTQEDFALTGIVFRCHHSLADGFSVLNLMTSSSDDEFGIQQPARVRIQKPGWRIFLERVSFVFRIPYEAMKVCSESYDVHEWKLPEHKLVKRLTSVYYPLVPITRLKAIRAHYGVSLTTVILEVFSGTLRNFMLHNKVKVPETIHCLTPLPLHGHSEKLRNHMTGCFTELPIGLSDPIQRLYKIEKHLITLKLSTFPWTVSLFLQILGGFPAFVLDAVAKSVLGSAVMTNFPGPDRRLHFFNRPLHELNFGGGLHRGTLGIGMSSISYNGMISFLVGIDKAICPHEQSRETISNLITQEIELLESLMVNEV